MPETEATTRLVKLGENVRDPLPDLTWGLFHGSHGKGGEFRGMECLACGAVRPHPVPNRLKCSTCGTEVADA